MSKKDKVRQHIESMQGGSSFNVASVAGSLGVTPKDVSNVIAELKQTGIVEGEVKNGHKYMTYTLVKNVQNAVALKKAAKPTTCNCDPKAIAAGMLHSASCPLYKAPIKRVQQDSGTSTARLVDKGFVKKTPAKRRSPFIMAIDAEIKRMENRIALLRKTRREFE